MIGLLFIEVATESVRSYEKTRGVIMKRTKQTWEEVGSDVYLDSSY